VNILCYETYNKASELSGLFSKTQVMFKEYDPFIFRIITVNRGRFLGWN
jgi:hypothetical protein